MLSAYRARIVSAASCSDQTALKQDGSAHGHYGVARLTGLNQREGWPDGVRLLVRRVRPAGRHKKKLTAQQWMSP